MAGKDIPAASAVVTVTGTAAGYITVADSSLFFKGARCWMNIAAGTSPVEVQITSINGGGANTIGLKLMPVKTVDLTSGTLAAGRLVAPNYGQSDATQFVNTTWSIFQPSQFIYATPDLVA
jgi:hypothetical protein